VWNAAGGISWATTIGLIAYFVGNTATSAITAFGMFGLLAVVLAAAGVLLLHRLHSGKGPTISVGKDRK
jgi:membrane protein DedA with SNARE-associated domain